MKRAAFWPFLAAFFLQTFARAQEFVFEQTAAPAALESFFSMQGKPASPIIWALQYGAKELPLEGEWCPTGRFYAYYRFRNLRYWFGAADSAGAARASGRIRDFLTLHAEPSLRADFQNGWAQTFSVEASKGRCVGVGFLATDFQKLAEAEKNFYQKKAAQLGDLLRKPGSPERSNRAFAEIVLEIGAHGNPTAVALAEKLIEKHGLRYGPPPGKNGDGQKSESKNGEKAPQTVGPKKTGGQKPESKNGEKDPQTGEPKKGDEQLDIRDAKPKNDGQTKSREKSDQNDDPSKSDNKKVEEGGNSAYSGLDGPIKIKIPFPKWTALALKMIAQYFGVDKILGQALLVFYLLAPELVDQIGSFLGELQRAALPQSFSDFMDKLADVYLKIERLIPMAKKLYDLATDPDLAQLVKNFDFGKIDVESALTEIKKAGIEFPAELRDRMHQIAPLLDPKMYADPAAFQGKMLDFARREATVQGDKMLQRAGIPISLSSLGDCADRADAKKCAVSWTENAAREIIALKGPRELSRHLGAIDHALNGRYKAALAEAATAEIAERAGISPEEMRQAWAALEREDWRGFLTAAVRAGMAKSGKCPELTDHAVRLIEKGQMEAGAMRDLAVCILRSTGKGQAARRVGGAWDAAREAANEIEKSGGLGDWAEQKSRDLKKQTEQAVRTVEGIGQSGAKAFLSGQSEAFLRQKTIEKLRETGFSKPGAAEAIVDRGDFDKASLIQMGQGSRRPEAVERSPDFFPSVRELKRWLEGQDPSRIEGRFFLNGF